jgi:hypothetical protein
MILRFLGAVLRAAGAFTSPERRAPLRQLASELSELDRAPHPAIAR